MAKKVTAPVAKASRRAPANVKAKPSRKPKSTGNAGVLLREDPALYVVEKADLVTLEEAARLTGKTPHNIRDYNVMTNEERRVGQYSQGSTPTTANTVGPDTPLEALNLNWRERDLPEKVRTKHVHRLHPYLGKYIPQLVEIFLRKFFSPGQTVIDPFCGSGTTLVEANALGIHSVGYDVSAFNVLLCTAKTDRYNVREARSEILDVLQKVRDATQSESQSTLWEKAAQQVRLSATDNKYLQEWFAPAALLELLTYRKLIDSVGYRYDKLLKVILCRSARSSRLTTHFDLDFPKRPQTEPYWCYKHSRDCRPTTTAFQFLERYSMDTVKRIEEFFTLRTSAKVSIRHEDSLSANFPPANGIITSPPYVGLIDYHAQHAYAYHLLGLEDLRHKEIGAAAGGSSQKAKEKYQANIGEVLRRAANMMPSGSPIIVVAGDRQNLYPAIASLAGLQQEAIVQRHVNRRTGRRSSEFFESIFVWRKS